MKLFCLLILIITTNVLSSKNLMLSKNLKTKKSAIPLKLDKMRFIQQNKDETNKNEINFYVMNTELATIKENKNRDLQEQEVYPFNAASMTHFSLKISWFFWALRDYPAQNSISGRSWQGWRSKRKVPNVDTYDWVDYFFPEKVKLDTILIEWTYRPSIFKVSFNTRENGPFIAVTDQVYKYHAINHDGSRGEVSKVTYTDVLNFKKAIFAKTIRIEMWNPIDKMLFGIRQTKFYNNITRMLIVNKTLDPCRNICMYVNTDVPRENTVIQGMSCVSGMLTADNREIFQYYNDKSLRSLNGNLCVGFDTLSKEIILRGCRDNPFFVKVNTDFSLSFLGYETECIGLETDNNMSENFITEKTEIEVSNEYDRNVYKKENMLSKLFLT